VRDYNASLPPGRSPVDSADLRTALLSELVAQQAAGRDEGSISAAKNRI